VKKYFLSLLDRLNSLARKSDVDNVYTQIAALLEIRDFVGPGVPLGPFRGWAMSPDSLLFILRDVLARKAARVVEFGTGESTIAIAAALKAAGAGSLTAIEHNPRFAEYVFARIEKCTLEQYADIRVVPIRKYDLRPSFLEFSSYDLADFEVDFDVAVVDGPIVGEFGSATRIVPIEWALKRLRGEGAVYLDDASREDELHIIQTSIVGRSGLDVTTLETEKGLLRLRHSDATAISSSNHRNF
jgi:precorrin-6B methylase 2